ncbi:MAG TPA: murein transglycosylase A [Kofleriaceae bacterium]|nr:murein transglycosylase A [Kofleriaceae bacterium]
MTSRVAAALLIASARAATAQPAACTCAEAEPPPPAHDELTLRSVKFADLPGWADDHLAEAMPAFLASCGKLAELRDDDPVGVDGHGGKAKQWRHACAAAAKVPAGDEKAARAFFETEFAPFEAAGRKGPIGKLTGYYVQEIHASRTKKGKYAVPVLARPADLVMVDLGAFVHDGHGRHVWGRLDKGTLVPYYTRAEIRTGALAKSGLELIFADDPVDLLFAQIEGSAKAKLDDGSELWLEFDGKNGRSYKGVGGVLKELGESSPSGFTMQGIRKWFGDHPSRFDEIADQDASYVFFKTSAEPGAIGSQKTVLVPKRSMAVDRAFIAMSTPIFVETKAPVVGKPGTVAPWQHLLVAQDTGAGIQGAVRGDIYWGADRDAEELGGRMGGSGRYWLLLPRGVSR